MGGDDGADLVGDARRAGSDAVEGTREDVAPGFEHERGDAFATRAEEDVALQAGEILRGAAETVDEDEESGRAPRRGGGGTVEGERRAGVKAETGGVGVRAPAGRGCGRARARQTRGPSGRGDESVARGVREPSRVTASCGRRAD